METQATPVVDTPAQQPASTLPPAVEGANGATPPPASTTDMTSDKFLALARKEKAVVKARQELAQQKADIEARAKAIDAERAEFSRWKQLKENAKLDPEAYLTEAGLTYGYLTERALKGGHDPKAIAEANERRFAEFERRQKEAAEKAVSDQKAAAEKLWQQQVQDFVTGINEFVETNAETYELTTLHGQQALIWEVIQEGARRGQTIKVKEAADKVEAYLSEQVEKALSSKKFKDKYVKPTPPPAAEGSTRPDAAPTLNNAMSASTSVMSAHLTEKQRDQRALDALNKALGE